MCHDGKKASSKKKSILACYSIYSPQNLDDEFDEGDSEPGFVSELEESEVDSDDIEDNDASDMDISGVENRYDTYC